MHAHACTCMLTVVNKGQQKHTIYNYYACTLVCKNPDIGESNIEATIHTITKIMYVESLIFIGHTVTIHVCTQ